MNAIEQVHAHLASLSVAGGIHHVHNRVSPPKFPYVLTTVIASPVNTSLRGESDLQNNVFQIDVFALAVAESVAIAKSIAALMPSFPAGSSVRTDLRTEYEEGVKAYRISQDFSVWSRD